MAPPAMGDVQARPVVRRSDRRLLGLLIVVLSVWWFLRALGVYHPPWGLWVSSALIVIGIWQISTPRRSHSHWPVALGAILTLALFLGSVSLGSVPSAAFGDQEFRPTTLAQLKPDYAVGAGDATVDLSSLQFPRGTTRLTVKVGFGNVRITVPARVTVDLSAKIGFGRLALSGRRVADGVAINNHYDLAGSDPTSRLALSVSVGAGDVDVDINRS
jgi:cell wall-active antibiotic response 4TMS protein YvqF